MNMTNLPKDEKLITKEGKSLHKRINRYLSRIGLAIFPFQQNYHYVPDIYGQRWYKLKDPRKDKIFFEEARKVIDQKRTSLYYDRLFTLYEILRDLLRKYPSINIVESGVYRGGTSYFLASIAQHLMPGKIHALYSIDTFQGHSARDIIPGEMEGAHFASLFGDTNADNVRAYLSVFSFVHVLAGRIQDVAPTLTDTQFHFVHLDMDIYHPTIFALQFFGKQMVKGGSLS